MTNPLELATLVPDFTLPADDGEKVSLSLLRGKYVVVYFYPKDDTPGCTVEAQDFRDLQAQFRKRGVVVLGVSRDSVKSHCSFRDKYELNFRLLSDADRRVHEAYGAWGEKVMYGKRTEGAIRCTFLIDPDGKLRRSWPKVKAAGHAAEVLAAIDEVRGGSSPGLRAARKKTLPARPAARGGKG